MPHWTVPFDDLENVSNPRYPKSTVQVVNGKPAIDSTEGNAEDPEKKNEEGRISNG